MHVCNETRSLRKTRTSWGARPVFAGTRVPVDLLISHLKAGDTLDEFLDGFPSVRREQAEAFLDLVLTASGGRGPHTRPARREPGPTG